MPPCQKVLINKIKRTQSLTRMIKSSNENSMQLPEAYDGYRLNESKEFEIAYFSGYPYPQNFSDVMNETLCDEDKNSTNNDNHEFDCELSSSDEEYEENIEDDDWN